MALNLTLVALTAPNRPVHAPNDRDKTRLSAGTIRQFAPRAHPAQSLRAATGEDTHDIWTG
ncbi:MULTISPECIES: hypothetical protein [unclassified Ruegeria]|uniref:hypothetical protein n=1 Tax=unclassified Ruegeria TaxID=2625375 RepID=UPI001488C212|nr:MULTISPECIES: hypothetical protein [unclassified Ruegeria]